MNSIPKYSLLEIEKKWIVNKDKLPDLSKLIMTEMTDKYFPGTRTRLRKMLETNSKNSNGIIYKLTKKYGKISHQCEPLTTLYLTESEYDLFNKANGFILIKKVYRFPYSGKDFLIEIFTKPEMDFILLEVEAASEKEINEILIPDFAAAEVTNDKEYEGYTIASRCLN